MALGNNLEISRLWQGCTYQVRKLVSFRISVKLRCKATDNEWLQTSTICFLGNACHFDFKLIKLIFALVNSDVQTISVSKELSVLCSLPQALLYFVLKSCFHYKTCESLVATGNSNHCEYRQKVLSMSKTFKSLRSHKTLNFKVFTLGNTKPWSLNPTSGLVAKY